METIIKRQHYKRIFTAVNSEAAHDQLLLLLYRIDKTFFSYLVQLKPITAGSYNYNILVRCNYPYKTKRLFKFLNTVKKYDEKHKTNLLFKLDAKFWNFLNLYIRQKNYALNHVEARLKAYLTSQPFDFFDAKIAVLRMKGVKKNETNSN